VWLFVRRPRVSGCATVLAQLLSISMVVTNWSLGLALSAARWPLARALRYTAIALLLAVALSHTQSRIFPYAGEFYHRYAMQAEEQFIGHTELKTPHKVQPGWVDCVQGILVNSAVAPQPAFDTIAKTSKIILNNQDAGWRHYGPVGVIALMAWAMMLGLSGLQVFSRRGLGSTTLAISAFLGGQLVLHILYGDITFLYAADYFVVMMVFAAQGAKGRWRALHNAAMVCFLVAGAYANTQTLTRTTHMAAQAAQLAAQRAPLKPAPAR